MQLNEYQVKRAEYAVYPDAGTGSVAPLTYSVLALCGEAGELANKLKKHLRASTDIDARLLADELGDVLWYVAAVASELGWTLEDVAKYNLGKLLARNVVERRCL